MPEPLSQLTPEHARRLRKSFREGKLGHDYDHFAIATHLQVGDLHRADRGTVTQGIHVLRESLDIELRAVLCDRTVKRTYDLGILVRDPPALGKRRAGIIREGRTTIATLLDVVENAISHGEAERPIRAPEARLHTPGGGSRAPVGETDARYESIFGASQHATLAYRMAEAELYTDFCTRGGREESKQTVRAVLLEVDRVAQSIQPIVVLGKADPIEHTLTTLVQRVLREIRNLNSLLTVETLAPVRTSLRQLRHAAD